MARLKNLIGVGSNGAAGTEKIRPGRAVSLKRYVESQGNRKSANQAGALGIEGPAGDQVLHANGVVPAAQAVVQVELVGLLELLPVQLHAQAGPLRQIDAAVHNLQRRPGQALQPLLPDPVGVDAVELTGTAAAHWVIMAREISKWLLEWQPHIRPKSLHIWPTRTEPAMVQK